MQVLESFSILFFGTPLTKKQCNSGFTWFTFFN